MNHEQLSVNALRAGRVAIAGCALAIALTACTPPGGGSATEPSPSGSATMTPTPSPDPIVVREETFGDASHPGPVIAEGRPLAVYDLSTPDSLMIILFGSSSCRPTPVSSVATPSGIVDIQTKQWPDTMICTEDLATAAYQIDAPSAFDPAAGLSLDGAPLPIETVETEQFGY